MSMTWVLQAKMCSRKAGSGSQTMTVDHMCLQQCWSEHLSYIPQIVNIPHFVYRIPESPLKLCILDIKRKRRAVWIPFKLSCGTRSWNICNWKIKTSYSHCHNIERILDVRIREEMLVNISWSRNVIRSISVLAWELDLNSRWLHDMRDLSFSQVADASCFFFFFFLERLWIDGTIIWRSKEKSALHCIALLLVFSFLSVCLFIQKCE